MHFNFTGLVLSLKLLNGDLAQLQQESPLLFKNLAITHKLGFSDVIMPGKSTFIIFWSASLILLSLHAYTVCKCMYCMCVFLENQVFSWNLRQSSPGCIELLERRDSLAAHYALLKTFCHMRGPVVVVFNRSNMPCDRVFL